jgi:uncharacterized protein (TIGR03000 family)
VVVGARPWYGWYRGARPWYTWYGAPRYWGYPRYVSYGYPGAYVRNDYNYYVPTYNYPPAAYYPPAPYYPPAGEPPAYMPPTDSGELPEAPPTPGSGAASAPATVRLILPDPDAEVWVNGELISAAGPVRTVRTPPLDPGQDYHYAVTVSWRQHGRLMTARRTVGLTAGRTAVVDFTRPSPGTGVRTAAPSPSPQ